MFDPLSISTISRNDVISWKCVSKQYRCPLRAVILLQKRKHAVILKENMSGKKDQIIADRLKIMCNLTPMYTTTIKIPLLVRSGKEMSTVPIEYFMFAAPFTIKNSKIIFEHEITYQDCDSALKLELSVKLEMCKILFFRYIIGTNNSSFDHIIMRNDLPMSISEMFIGNNPISRDFIAACFGNSDIVMQSQKEVTKDFDLDIMRGILLQTEQPERNIKRYKPKGPTHVPVLRIAILMEERVDVIRTSSFKELQKIFLID